MAQWPPPSERHWLHDCVFKKPYNTSLSLVDFNLGCKQLVARREHASSKPANPLRRLRGKELFEFPINLVDSSYIHLLRWFNSKPLLS